ncbi:hypothetical protein LV75_000740 [Actinokineospora diospyrosa]|uniref:Uncharacterized protein n=1 Tax=Actinokineospora diospyrosa TaxID=103728 RepID=A0ABT1I6L1_9PSEU|nr:hypothetical protein [Actinokineospora diospyrosa]
MPSGRLACGIATRFGRPRRLAATSASDPRFSSFARWGGPVLCGAPTTPVAGPQSRGRKEWPCPPQTLRLPSPHTKQVHPIEHLAPATPTVQALGWQRRRGRAGLAPAVSSVQALSRWVGAGLTAVGLAPLRPGVRVGWGRSQNRCGPPTAGRPTRSTESRAPDIQPIDAARQTGSGDQRPVDSRRRCGQPRARTTRVAPTLPITPPLAEPRRGFLDILEKPRWARPDYRRTHLGLLTT